MAARIFKPCQQNQPTFLPPSLEELLGANHPVRFVNHGIEGMDLESILASSSLTIASPA